MNAKSFRQHGNVILSHFVRPALCALAAFVASSVSAATLASYGQDDQIIDVCQLNLARDSVRMYWRAADGSQLANFGRLGEWLEARHEQLVCATNAGIYGTDLRPIGLYIEAGKTLHKLNTRKDAYGNFYLQPNGVLLLSDHEAAILSTDEVASDPDSHLAGVRYATQSGPILLHGGKINALFTEGSENRVVRSAACVISATDIALVRSRSAINFYDFARQLRDKLGCRDALYLDGSVSQLYPYDNGKLGPSFAAMIGVTIPAKP
jgi:uncharacterized protein YigE (DUF2233 family)